MLPNIQVTSALVRIASGEALAWHPDVQAFNAVGDHPYVKLMASLGPASNNPDEIRRMMEQGADLFRINLSHVEGPEQMGRVAQSLLWTRLAAAHLKREVLCVIDTRGPEIRTRGTEPLALAPGERVRLTTRPGVSHRGPEGTTIHLRIPHGYDLVADLKGSSPKNIPKVFIDDGQIVLELEGWPDVFDSGAPDFWGVVRKGGVIPATPKGVNFPDFELAGLPDLVREDEEALTHIFSPAFFQDVLSTMALDGTPLAERASADGLAGLASYLSPDALALSFTRHAPMVAAYDDLLRRLRARHVFFEPKIETPGAAEPEVLEAILRHPRVGGVWLARGDFSVNAGLVNVPAYEERLTMAARRNLKPSTLATRILSSLSAGSGQGTQPEFDAIFAALRFGFHRFMFSGETAAPIPGMAPADVIRLAAAAAASPSMEAHIAASEVRRAQRREVFETFEGLAGEALQTNESIGTQTRRERRRLKNYIYSLILDHVQKSERHRAIGAMALWSETGGSMRAVASALPSRPVYVVTNNPRVAREGAGLRGIFPILLREKPASGRALIDILRTVLVPPPGSPRDLLIQVIHNFDQ